MEELCDVNYKTCAKYLQQLRTRYGETDPILIRRDKVPGFAKLDQDWCAFLEKQGWAKMEHVAKWLTDDKGMPQQFDVTALHLLDPALKFLEGSKVTMEEHIDRKIIIEPEEPAWKQNKRFNNFARTERGGAILSSKSDALISDMKGNIQALRRADLSRSEWKARQIWLKYELMYRSEDFPEPLRHEAEDYRDLPFTRHRNSSKQPTSPSGGIP